MEIKEYVAIIRKWLWLMILCAVVAGASSYLGTRKMPRIYQASTTIMVGQNIQATNPNSMDIWTSQQLAQTYSTLVSRWPIRQAVAQALGLEYVPGPGTFSARLIEGTQLVEISVRDTDPDRARVLAEEVVHQLILQTPANSPQEEDRRAFIQKQLTDLEGKIEQTQQDIQDEQARLDAANSARAIQQYQANISALQQRLSTYQATYASLLLNVESEVNNISIVEPAFTPTTPISPNVKMNVMLAAAIGLALAVAGAFLSEYIDDTVKTPEDVERLTGLTTLGLITRIEGADYPQKLIALNQPLSPITEAYRILRTNIQFTSIDKPMRTILMTSPGPSEGKSVSLANLAIVIAQSGLKVVLIDTDLRRPVQHKIFGLPNNHGLCDAILQPSLNSTDLLQATEVPNLFVLTSGALPPNPAELLASERMRVILDNLQKEVDIVLLDSPPSLVVADASILSSRADGVLLVNDSGHTRRGAATKSAEELHRVRANLLGVILNQAKVGGSGYYHYNYYYYRSADGTRSKRRHHHSWWEKVWPFRRAEKHPAKEGPALRRSYRPPS